MHDFKNIFKNELCRKSIASTVLETVNEMRKKQQQRGFLFMHKKTFLTIPLQCWNCRISNQLYQSIIRNMQLYNRKLHVGMKLVVYLPYTIGERFDSSDIELMENVLETQWYHSHSFKITWYLSHRRHYSIFTLGFMHFLFIFWLTNDTHTQVVEFLLGTK